MKEEEIDNGTALEWYLLKPENEKIDLRYKHFPDVYIEHSSQFGFHFTFGQLKEMYSKEHCFPQSHSLDLK